MWQRFIRSLSFWRISLYFRFKTWKNRRVIARAYRPPHSFRLTVSPSVFKKIGIGLGVVCFLVLCIYAAPIILSGLGKSFLAVKKGVGTQWQKMDAGLAAQRKEHDLAAKTAFAPHQEQTVAKTQITLDSAVTKTCEGLEYGIVASKSSRTLSLFLCKAGIWQLVKKYNIAIGQKPGPKMVAGDKRTPEGIYCIIGRKEKSELAAIYGPLSFVLDYPNEEDRKAGRTGEGIWIHGTHPDSQPNFTKGCLELHNENLTELGAILDNGIGTPVIISALSDTLLPGDSLLSLPYVKQRRTAMLAARFEKKTVFDSLVLQWARAWESRNIASFASFYDTVDFQGQGQGWNTFRMNKERTFALYDTINIDVKNMIVRDISDTSATVIFVQTYRSDKTRSTGNKKLSLAHRDGTWKITRELTTANGERPL